MSYSGYLHKRNVPISPPSMSRVYAVLWGTMMLDYDSEEEANASLSPRVASEILGISEWDGQGRANQYPNGFLLVTHTGGTYYLSAASLADRNEWILHVRRALECYFANPDIVPFKPSKMIQPRPALSTSPRCAKTHLIAANMSQLTHCRSCGRGFSSSEYVSDHATLLQLGSENREAVCVDCKNMQSCILWLKSINYVHTMAIHEISPSVNKETGRYKSTFQLLRRVSNRLDQAATLLEQGSVSPLEFEQLRFLDQNYRREMNYEEGVRLKAAMDALGSDMQTIISLLLNPSSTDRGGRTSFFQVIAKILEVADNDPELIDFYWPQLLQVHLIEAKNRTPLAMTKLDLLQQALLVLTQKYPPLGLKLAWALHATSSDYGEKRVTQSQYAACMCLLLQLEMIISGDISTLADVPRCKVLARALCAAPHQQQEMAIELGTLFLVRRRLQEMYDDKSYFQNKVSGGEITESSSSSEGVSVNGAKGRRRAAGGGTGGGLGGSMTCLALLKRLGVGEAPPPSSSPEPSLSFGKSGSIDAGEGTLSDPFGAVEEEDEVEERDKEEEIGEGAGEYWAGFGLHLDFIDRLVSAVESLRFVDRFHRTEALRRELATWNPASSADFDGEIESECAMLGWDPTGLAGEPAYRITQIFVEECRVFRTKARAPSLIVCEVRRDDSLSACVHTDFVVDNKPSVFPSSPEKASGSGRILVAAVGLEEVSGFLEQGISKAIAGMQEAKEGSSISEVERGADSAARDVDLQSVTPLHQHKRTSKGYLSSNRKASSVNFRSLLSSASSGDLLLTEESTILTSPTGLMYSSSTNAAAAAAAAAHAAAIGEVGDEEGDVSELQFDLATLNEMAKANRELLESRLSNRASAIAGGTSSSHQMSMSDFELDAATTKAVIANARKLLESGKIDMHEYEVLIACDHKYRDEAAREEAAMTLLRVESAFGECWSAKKERLLSPRIQAQLAGGVHEGPLNEWPLYDLRVFIVKSNDDLRQEVCCLQLMRLCAEIFADFDLNNMLWLKPYRIVSTGSNTGIVQVLTDTLSLDALKKSANFVNLPMYFEKTYGSSQERLLAAKRNFAASLAAYSLFAYILQIKDRHNGNILLDIEGHLIHIDFGFLLSIAPGGAFSLESAPFKLTEEMVEVLDGLESPLFGEFVKAFTTGFLALRANSENIIATLQVLSTTSPFPCFAGKDATAIIERLRGRFRADLTVKEFVQHCLDLIIASYGHFGTKQYDSFQWYTNGISV